MIKYDINLHLKIERNFILLYCFLYYYIII